MARNTLSKKELKELRKAGGGSPGGRKIVFLLVGLTVLAILAIFGFAFLITSGNGNVGGDAENFTPNDRGLLPVGSQAPAFTAETVDGGKASLGDSGDYRATMLVFFASWCPHCNREAPIISDLKGEHRDLRVIMVGIDGRDDPEKVREFVDRYGIEGPAVYDRSLGSTYQATGYPTIYVIGGNDKIVAAHSGEAPKSVLEGWIEEAFGSNG